MTPEQQTQLKKVLGSADKFATLLRALDVDPPTKISPTTGKEVYAFAKSDEGLKALMEHDDIRVQMAVASRLATKSTLEESRTQRFVDIADRGTLAIPLKYYGAHTGRWSGDEQINLQNIPRKSKMKGAFRAPDGFVVVDGDSSQIEARILAYWSGQNDLVEDFAKGVDVYRNMASSIFAIVAAEISTNQRQVGKTVILSAGYGSGGKKMRFALRNGYPPVNATESEATNYVYAYRERYACIPALWRQGDKVLRAIASDREMDFGFHDLVKVRGERGIELPNGMFLKYPNLRWETDEKTGKEGWVYDARKGRAKIKKWIWGGTLVENVCQALARLIIGTQMLMIARRYRILFTVHDSVVALVPEDEAEEGRAFIEACMRTRPKWAVGLPLNCETKVGATYGG